ncbi:hypothetical protein CC85DRAFT_325052 [Cutaneotrichosporon oleaginosum]|uniref:DUF4038 domain-containing protein n=1 Tax=Cutaneotrichosporon oleaginosum TaxID=879819 RepID=A0A0J0XYX8_9TREE|nr:uncharacterized protein CC85DRAFT_325052 [Cutaneotrichosporon oleaginosum]KLT46263.1 hypothetical protein CC85DRAFT_325052 [Cutaneotrichosporon oleaginosum]TXT10267.1 hypothetical protein COLE_04201 [Cutaneotrichosporon oleaginosum]
MPVDTEALSRLAVTVGPSGRTLERNGEPFVLHMDTAWELFHRLTLPEAEEYLDTRKAQGFNAVLAVALTELDARGVNECFGPDGALLSSTEGGGSIFHPNRYGMRPLLNDDPALPNAAYFSHVDAVINAAAQRDIIVFLVPTWGRWVNEAWSGPPVLFNAEKARSYGAYIGKRYPHLPKVLGGDSNPIWTDVTAFRERTAEAKARSGAANFDGLPITDSTAVVDSMAEGILSAEPEAFLTYHPTALALPGSPVPTASAFFGDRKWLALDACQSGHTDVEEPAFNPPLHFWDARASHVPLAQMWAAGKRPIIDLEGHYEDMRIGINPSERPLWNEHDVRAGAWQAVCAGACGIVYGHNNVWQMHSPEREKLDGRFKSACYPVPDLSWQDALKAPGTRGTRVIAEYLASLPREVHDTKAPAQDRLVSAAAPAEVVQRDGRVDVIAAGSQWLIAHSGHGYPFELDLSGFRGQARWLDPRSGEWSDAIAVEGGKQSFTPPSSGNVENDWVLEVKRA